MAPAQPPDTAESASPPNNREQLVSIDFNNVDIGVFIKFISDLTKKNFVIDDRVKGKVSIISPGKITVAEAYAVFESVLEVHGYAAVPAGEIIKIISSPDARTKNIKTRLQEESGVSGDTVVTQIIPLRYADPDEIKRLFTPLVSKSSIILAYSPTNTLIITDVQSNISRLMHILKIIDVTGVGQQIAIIPVEYADATKLVNVLTSVFKSTKSRKSAPEKDVTFVADERTNAIIVLASEGETENIRQLVKTLDKETPKGQAKIHVYYLEHATAEDLAAVLQNLPQKGAAKDEKRGKPTAPVISENVRITADKATNSLIINADMEDFLVLQNIIRKIDIPRAMVYIEALIMEVNVDKDLRLGTEWLAGGETSIDNKDAAYVGGFGGGALGGDDAYTYTGNINAAAGNTVAAGMAPGFSMGLFGESITVGGIQLPTITAIIQAYKKDTDVKILSTPQILTTDNQEAKITVGKNLPFQTTATASTSTGEVYNSYEYRDVGKTLTITPHISKDRMVRLELSLEVSDIENTADNRPTTLKRTVETTAIVRDRHTVVLGGLIDDNMSTTDYKVPCLGDIPGLGWAFRSMSKSNSKTNLYVFLTPRVIQNSKEATEVYSDKRQEIENVDIKEIKLYPWKSKKKGKSPFPPPPPEHLQQPAPDKNDAPLSESSWKSDTPDTPDATATSNDIGYTIQVTSEKSADKASQLLEQLTQKGYPAYTVRSEVDGQIWYRLRIGYYKTPGDADEVMSKLRLNQFKPTLIKL